MKNTADLRGMLLEEIAAVRNGSSSPQRLRAIATAASTVVKSKQLDMDWNVAAMKHPSIGASVDLAA